jgi:arginine:agmatine antiporter
MWGAWAATAVSVAIVISSFGSLNGWTLLMGQVPMAAAQDRLFPALFARRSSRGVPAIGMVVSASFASILVLVQASGGSGFAAIYALIVGLATMTAAIPYAFCSIAGVLIAARNGRVARVSVVEVVAFIFSVFVVYGCGPQAVLYGLVLLLLGLPVYVWQRRQGALVESTVEVPLPAAAGRLT